MRRTGSEGFNKMTGFSVMAGSARRALAILTALLLLISWVPATLAQGSDDTSYEMETGQTVTWTAPWALDPEFSGAEEGVETVFLSTQFGSVVVMALPPDLDVEEVRDTVLDALFGEFDSATSIDRGAYDDLSYSLDILVLDDFEFGTFSLFRTGSGSTPTFVQFFMAPVSLFSSEFSSAQSSVQIDGAGIFNGVGGQGLQDLLVANSGSASDGSSGDDGAGDDTADDGADAADDGADDGTDATDDGTDDQSDDSGDGGESGLGPRGGDDDDGADDQSDATDDGTDSANDGADDESDATDDGTDATDDGADDGDDPVPSGSESFAGSAFGIEFTWDSSWTINENLDAPVNDGEEGYDSVALTRTNDEVGLLTLTVMPEVEPGVDGLVAYWQSDDFVSQAISSPDGGVLMADSDGDHGAVVLLDYLDDGTQIVIYREAWYLEAEQAYVTSVLISIPAHLESSIDAANEGVTVDGDAVLTYFTYDDIIAAAGQDPESTI
jgi:hypothetical protein